MRSAQPAARLDGETRPSPKLVINQVLKQEASFPRQHSEDLLCAGHHARPVGHCDEPGIWHSGVYTGVGDGRADAGCSEALTVTAGGLLGQRRCPGRARGGRTPGGGAAGRCGIRFLWGTCGIPLYDSISRLPDFTLRLSFNLSVEVYCIFIFNLYY